MAVGEFCCISHAEPRKYYTENEIINCYDNRKIIYDFTWTDNGAADEKTASMYLRNIFGYS